MDDRKQITLTERELNEIRTLLAVVLTNADQWADWNLAALRRVHNKMQAATRA